MQTSIHAPVGPELVRVAAEVQRRSMPPHLVDDRYLGDPPVVMIIAEGDSGTLSGWWRNGTLHVTAELDGTGPGTEILSALMHALQTHLGGLEDVELWGRPQRPAFWQVAADLDFSPRRHLLQLGIQLPPAAEAVPTRPFVAGRDESAVVDVNNRAFAWHPEQSGWTVETLRGQMEEPWFDPAGLRLFEEGDQVVGFCWVKVHDGRDLGEIYVIGLDPSVHGRGLGGPMTAAGLHWMADQGLPAAILFVEADNEPAVRTYLRLGFEEVASDRSWGPAP